MRHRYHCRRRAARRRPPYAPVLPGSAVTYQQPASTTALAQRSPGANHSVR
ncbi:hypothetical protein KCP75_02660 [Salmonella enterica subsp. enterica]|nr:hypothetical protein KCP75_02660 [Salmonella enterica subsp. enterica]